MLETLLLSLILTVLFVTYLIHPSYSARIIDRFQGLLPPGPLSLPFIGAPGINKQSPWETLTAWADKYGAISSFFYGSEYTVMLSDCEVIKAAMKNPAFEGRPLNHSAKLHFAKGIAFAEGDMWKRHRKSEVTSLRALIRGGSQQTVFDEHLQDCAEKLVSTLQKTSTPFSPTVVLLRAVADVISFLIFKDSLSSSDPRFDEMIECCEKIFSVDPSTDIIHTFPWLKNIHPFKSRHTAFNKAHTDMFHVVDCILANEQTDNRRKSETHSNNYDDEPTHLADALYKEQKAASADHPITDDEITVMCTENYMAGTEDTSIVLRRTLYALLLFPEVQRKLQQHVDEVIGQSRRPKVADRSSLTFLEAALNETQRLTNSMPPLPHRLLEDTNFMGFKLPKDSVVVLNTVTASKSADTWENPLNFQPERFLTKDGKLSPISCSKFLGFGEGRRSCPGENVAKTTIIVMLATILQNFSVCWPDGQIHHEMDRLDLAKTLFMPDFDIVFRARAF